MINQKLVDLLKNGSTLLTPTRRLASRLLNEVNSKVSKTQKVWITPKIFALEDWFMQLWNQFEIEGEIECDYLNPMQSLLRWEAIIQASDKGKFLFQPHVTAKTAIAAWKTCHQWLALSLLDEKSDNIEMQAFQEWAAVYQQWLSNNQFIDQAQLPSEILKKLLLRQSKNALYSCENKELMLFGFEEFSPFNVYFFETLANVGWKIIYGDPEPIVPHSLCQKSFANEAQEWAAAALWARERLQEHKKNIAIVTPHLTSQRSQIEEVFNDCLMPFHICHPQAQINPFFNISTAIPLIQYPIIQSALDFLKLGLSTITLKDYIDILTSPFTKGSQEENIERASYALWLKLQNDPVQMDAHYLKRDQAKKPPIWQAILVDIVFFIKNIPEYQTFSEWAQTFTKLLVLMGWPGERALNSVEHQAVKRWQDLLNETHYCDSVLPPATFHTAVMTLQKLAANVPFQAENKGAPIQILGILEAAGQHFDHLWIMGLHAQVWPAMASPNPFLPAEHQRRHDMPHASPERELLYAKKVTERLQESATEVIFSYPLQEKERTLEPSELIRHIPLAHYSQQGLAEVRCAEKYFNTSIILEKKVDNNAPALCIDENIRGSSNTLTLQAACPFKAFAELRLHAKEHIIEEIWLSPQQQGTLIHGILDQFWKIFPSQAALLAASADNVEEKLATLIEYNLKKFIRAAAPLPYVQVEKQRLNRLLQTYLHLEKQRAPFEIAALESQKSLNLAGMHFTLRLDRIDKNPQGDFYIIDYKTGQFSLAGLWGARPKVPQLPLYFLCADALKPKAIFVTKIHSQGCEFEGLSKVAVDIPGLKLLHEIKEVSTLLWEDLTEYWTLTLNNLARDFQEGKAQVSPLESQTCEYCHLKPFCRVGEST